MKHLDDEKLVARKIWAETAQMVTDDWNSFGMRNSCIHLDCKIKSFQSFENMIAPQHEQKVKGRGKKKKEPVNETNENIHEPVEIKKKANKRSQQPPAKERKLFCPSTGL